MSKIVVSCAIGMAVLVLGCSRARETSRKGTEAWKRGDVAVVEPAAADFFEAQVLEVSDGRLKVQRRKGGDSLVVGAGDAYRVPQGASKTPSNSWAICRIEPHEWVACRIVTEASSTAPDGGASDRITVLDATGSEQTIPAVGTVIDPTGLTAMNIQRRFEQLARRATFEKSFHQAGQVRRIAGWQPAPRRLVLASRQGQWFGAQVVEVDDERVVVRWDGQKALTDLSRDEVGPQPPACGPIARGDRALRRPSGHGAAWTQVAVLGVDGTEAVVEDVERARATVQLRDLCALGGGTAAAGAK